MTDLTASAPPSTEKKKPGLAGILFAGFWVVVFASLAYYLAASWNSDLFARYGLPYLEGLWVTVSLVVSSFVCGAILSVPIAFGRMAESRTARVPSFLFVYFFRGTPLIAQIFLVYYGFGEFRGFLDSIGLWWFFREAWFCALFTIALNSAAYQAEILRGAIESVPKGQWEGGRSLGISRSVIFSRIVLPQAMIVALRPYANELILLIKGSAIVAIITVYDLFGITRQAYARTFDFQTYVWAAVLYLVVVEILRRLTNFAEARVTRHMQR
ncbi:amino acid ABC transporter, permease protein [Fulvimarina pelagi HTCC2506]|uniref:Amino acid ABC transporter, permease protein n=2 Tax=Fulvimarina pelagi TaxID=217511 RepID=Q0FYF4_9HYPH|nr:ABC transporter permease [Fulvimarina pelagi]EAU40041.1 amino acid ABC transporter, permease protein [Fulvimarina pelagi HTCC2506]BAT31083.1 amino acid ABC transporter permease [Fulvimarina pelagi]